MVSANTSPALEWLWRILRDIRHPQILDCGPVWKATVDVLLRRGAKLHVADLITPVLESDAGLWDHTPKTRTFRPEVLLAHLPAIPEASLTAVFGWHLLDLVPHEALAPLVRRLFGLLEPGGALFCLLREPYLPAGAETMWWFQNLTLLGASGEGTRPFPYPALTNREMERLVAPGSVKTFLTRSGRREVLAIK